MNKEIINLTWQDIQSDSEKIASEIVNDKYNPDTMLTILRGGAIPSVIISHIIGVRDIVTIPIKRTVDDKIMTGKISPEIGQDVNLLVLRGKKVLLIDDILGSGETMFELKNKLSVFGLSDLKTGVLVINLNNYEKSPLFNKINVDYVGRIVRGWIIFPWEK